MVGLSISRSLVPTSKVPSPESTPAIYSVGVTFKPPLPRLNMSVPLPIPPFSLHPRQGGPPLQPTGKPSDWVGPPPWVVRPTALSTAGSPSSSSTSLNPSDSIVPSPEPSVPSSPATVGDNASTETAATRSTGAPIGAIVGGVIGGLVLLAVTILAWWFFNRRKRRTAVMERKEPAISPFRTDLERQQARGDAPGGRSPGNRSSFQTTTSTLAADTSSQKGYLKSIHSIQRTASTAGSYLSSDASTSIMTPTSTENPQVMQAIRTLQTFLQPRMERIPEHHSGGVVGGFAEPTSPPPPAYEDSSSSGDPIPRRSMEKIRTGTE